MGAVMMSVPPGDDGFRAGGLPIRLLAQDAIRRARDSFAPRAATPASLPTPSTGTLPAAVVSTAVVAEPAPGPTELERALRGFSLLDLYIEARRVAAEAAVNVEHLEGLAAGRTYGAPGLQPGFLTPDAYRRAVADAKAQAEMAGATADFLRGMLGHEPLLTDLMAGADHA